MPIKSETMDQESSNANPKVAIVKGLPQGEASILQAIEHHINWNE